MLRAIRLENFRSFADSGRVELSDLNVFIGPNSAGKTNLMTVIELALRGPPRASSSQPLILDQISSFASFDSVVRRNGPVRTPNPNEFSVVLDYARDPRSLT
jgi:AAA15 family ATPase/GTPase